MTEAMAAHVYLDSGDVNVKTGNAPIFAKYRNITRPTPSVPPPMDSDLHWRLIAHLSLNYMTLLSVDALRSVVGLYNFRARVDRQTEQALSRLLEGIKGVKGEFYFCKPDIFEMTYESASLSD